MNENVPFLGADADTNGSCASCPLRSSILGGHIFWWLGSVLCYGATYSYHVLHTYQKEDQMARRQSGHMKGERYLANTSPSKLEVHDLDNEKTDCQINEIIKAGHDKPYGSLDAAKRDGFDNCAYCIGGSTR